MYFLHHISLGLIIILSNLINCITSAIPNNNVSISCENILQQFKNGLKSYEFIHQYNDYLANNGYVTKEKEPFVMLNGLLQPFPKNMSKDFFAINSVLSATQLILDNYFGLSNNQQRPTTDNIEEFLNKASQCIPNNIKCPKSKITADTICDPEEIYRSFNGTCNNLEKPFNGAALTAYSRLVEAFYDDNVFDIRKNWQGYHLISPREIVNKIWFPPQSDSYAEITLSNRKNIPNMGWYMFAQLLTHDIASSSTAPHSGKNPIQPIRCCSADYKTFISKSKMSETCLPFEIPSDDKYHQNTNLFCHNLIRHQPIFQNDCKLGPAQQLNRVTHFIDLSVIYGVTTEISKNLRTLESGMLKVDEYNILPIKDKNCDIPNCYYEGDFRATQTQPLALMHSLFVRLHNRIALTLKDMNPKWKDEKLFQESRRLNIAIYQNIVYNEFLPILIGDNLKLSNQYNKTVDPSSTNDFITGVLRSLHFLTPSQLEFYNADSIITKSITLSKMIIETKNYLKTNYDDITRGLLFQKINTGNLEEEIINKIFNGSDLISIDIQRGRDHGIAPYWRYREFCGYPPIKKFSDLKFLMSKKKIEKLKEIYSSPFDIDMYIGGQFEASGSNLMGPTFNCITRIQFSRYQTGDRFFYLHKNNPYPFTEAQLTEIKKFNFAKLICLVTNVTQTPEFSFYSPSKRLNKMIDCAPLKNLDLKDWKI